MFLKVDDSVSVNDIDLSLYIPRDVDETGITVASLERFSTYTLEKDENKLSDASGGRAENGKRSDLEEDNEGEGQENGAINAVSVDENLFTGEDLDELEEELNTLDLAEWHQTSNEKIEPTQQELKLTILIFFHLKLFNRMFVSHADSGELSSSKKGIFSLRLVFWLWLHLIVSSE